MRLLGIRSLWSKSAQSLSGGAAVIALASLLSRVLGLFRDRILAGEFGAGDELDVYYAAFRFPDALYTLVIVGALSAGFIPVFIAQRKKAKAQEHWNLANSFLTSILVILAGLSALFVVFAGWVVPLITPGFPPEKIAEVVMLSRIMFLSPIFLGVSAVFGGVLQSYRNFFVYSLSPIFYNVGIIIGALFFAPALGVVGLAWGVVLGAFFHMLIQIPALRALDWSYRPDFDFLSTAMRSIWRLTIPRTLALGAQQVNFLALTVVASYLTSGSVAIMNFANNIASVPVAIFGISYALAVFPSLSDRAADQDMPAFRKVFMEAITRVAFFVVPVALLFFILRAQIVRVVLGSSLAFDWEDTLATVGALSWLSVGILAQSFVPILMRAFYALQKSITPLVATLLGDSVTILMSLMFMRSMGVAGIALGLSAGACFQVLLLWLLLRIETGSLFEAGAWRPFAKIALGAVAMMFVAQGLKTGLGVLFGTSTLLAVSIQGIGAGLVALLTYASFLYILRSEELIELVEMVRDRLYWLTTDQESWRETQ